MTRLTRLGAATLVVGATAAACGDALGPVSDGIVRAIAERDSLRLDNLGDRPVFTTVVGVEAAPLADWYMCVDAALCLPIAAGATRTTPRPTWEGRPEREATVYWWRAVPGPDGAPRPDSLRMLRVRFP